MQIEIKTNLVETIPCLMKTHLGQLVLVTQSENQKYATVLGNFDGSDVGVGQTFKTGLKPDEYMPLPAGYQVTVIN